MPDSKKIKDVAFSKDPSVQDSIKRLYSDIQKRQAAGEDLTVFEQGILATIDDELTQQKLELKRIESILNQAYEILNQAESWGDEYKGLFAVLEKVVFLGIKQNTFKEYFDSLNESIADISRLDFRAQAEVTDIMQDKRNLLNFISFVLNLVTQTLEPAVVSRKVLNTLLSEQPDTLIIVTDQEQRIRFINQRAEEVLEYSHEQLIGQSISQFLPGITVELPEQGAVSMYAEPIKIRGRSRVIPAKLTITKAIENQKELDEYIYRFEDPNSNKQPDETDHLDEVVKYRQLRSLSQVIGSGISLEKAMDPKDESRFYVNTILEHAWIVKELIGGPIVDGLESLPKGAEFIFFDRLIRSVAGEMKEIKEGQVSFEYENDFYDLFFGPPQVLTLLVRNLLAYSLQHQPSKIEIAVKTWPRKGVKLLYCDDSSTAKGLLDQSPEYEVIRSIVDGLSGSLTVHRPNFFELSIPNANA